MNKFMSQTALLGLAAFLIAAMLLVGSGPLLYAQQKNPKAGTAVMVSGELWDSFMPHNTGPYYDEATSDIIKCMRIGNFDRQWSSPTSMWPGGWNFGAYWNKAMDFAVWDPDPTFNPATIGTTPNPSYLGSANYAFAGFPNTSRGKTLAGVSDAARTFSRETKWVDSKRHHALYEAGYPTTVGLDVKMRIHQYSLNWNNFNDFIIVEMTFTNTGVVDMNADGVAEKTGHVIEGLVLNAHGEYMSAYSLSDGAGRGNAFFATRAVGYIGDNDASGAPWASLIAYPGESGGGLKDMGIYAGPQRYMADVWAGHTFLGAKDSLGNDFPTRFGTHAVGVGAERGWYLSSGVGKGFNSSKNPPNDPRACFIGSMGTFYVDGGKSLDGSKFNLKANPNLFEAGSDSLGDIRTFVLKTSGLTAPNGDYKTTNLFGVNTYEPGWTKGFTGANNFDGDPFMGVGPFKLNVGEKVTITWVEYQGYRLQGLANALGTARWVFQNKVGDYELPFDYPSVPDVKIDNTLAKSVRVRWDNRADAGPGFAGYKVYKTSLSQQVDWLKRGTRDMDEYWRNTTVGPPPDSLKKPVNPNFTAQAFVGGFNGVPDGWGPYDLAAVIPKANLTAFADNSTAGYNYSWEDKVVDVGFKYWYYIAAYTDAALDLGTGYVSFNNKAATTTVETSNINRNGASGLWANTYPFAVNNPFFPKDAAGQKTIGAGFIVKSALANVTDLVNGKAKIIVKPNPYKKKALFDNATLSYDHKVVFINLPGKATITILDVSGQIVDVINFTSTDPNNGSIFWDMFSKDGMEVASGLYIYVVEYDGGQQVGYFSILR